MAKAKAKGKRGAGRFSLRSWVWRESLGLLLVESNEILVALYEQQTQLSPSMALQRGGSLQSHRAPSFPLPLVAVRFLSQRTASDQRAGAKLLGSKGLAQLPNFAFPEGKGTGFLQRQSAVPVTKRFSPKQRAEEGTEQNTLSLSSL